LACIYIEQLMRASFLAISLLAFSLPPLGLTAQTPASPTITDFQRALTGSWVGTLEYRDYSEPATSTKRVKLPTWLNIKAEEADLRFSYIYDDGPAKTVTDVSLIRVDLTAARYTVIDNTGKVEDSYAISGIESLRQGRGTLTLTGAGTENKAPVEVRTTLRIGRNILEITRETAAAGQPFTFRHAYTLVGAAPPAPTTGN
jgi:hypothetical protein